jgi:hypothetical protein
LSFGGIIAAASAVTEEYTGNIFAVGPYAVTVRVTHPNPTGTQPAVRTWDIYRAVTGALAAAIRVAAGVSSDWTDYAVASGANYSYRAHALGDNGAKTYSEWVS